MALYEITYAIIPPGVGPDDYEPHELERRTEKFELPEPEAIEGFIVAGVQQHYGPPMPLVHQVIEEHLGDGSRIYVSAMRQV